MQVSSKLLLRTAIVVLSLILALGIYLSLSATQQAKAVDATQWESIRSYVAGYVAAQYVADTVDGESGFNITAAALKTRIDPLGTGAFLGEGADAKNAPVLIDNLSSFTTAVPATSFRVNGKGGTAGGAVDPTVTPQIQTIVNNHRAAGFSTDIVVYCATGHSQSPTVMNYGAMSAAGYWGAGDGGAAFPKVYGLKFGRMGWNSGMGGQEAYPAPRTIGPTAQATPAGVAPTPPATDCTGLTGGDLVRCDGAANSTTPGLVQWPSTSDAGYQPIDIRPGGVPAGQYFVNGSAAPYSFSMPFNTMFSAANLATVNGSIAGTLKQIVLGGRTEHSSIIMAQGLKLLGINAVGLRWGLPQWNTSMGEQWTANPDIQTYACQGAAPCTGSIVLDNVAPTITVGPSTSNLTWTSVDISRTTNEPATSKIHLTGSDGSAVDVNSTILNASKTVSIYGLHPGVTYTGTLIAYNSQAYPSTTAAIASFTTPSNGFTPTLMLSLPAAYWGSYADYVARVLSVNWTITNTGLSTAKNVILQSASNSNGVTVNSGSPASYGDIAASAAVMRTIKYNVPSTAGSWHTANIGSAG